jgi:hypothetical protein
VDESGLRVLVARLQKESRSGHGGTPASNTGQSRAVLSLEAVSTPPAIWTKDRTSDQPGVALESGQELAVSSRFEEWRAERVGLLESRLQEIDAIASAGKLAEAVITAEGLSISPIRKDETDESESIARRLYGMLPRLRIT